MILKTMCYFFFIYGITEFVFSVVCFFFDNDTDKNLFLTFNRDSNIHNYTIYKELNWGLFRLYIVKKHTKN